MGEISRSDIQHAVQSALHDVRNDVSRISRMVDSMSKVAQEVHDVSRRLAALELEVRQIQNTVANTLGRPTTRRYPDPYVVGIGNEVTELKLRFTSVERFAQQMGEYIRKRDEQDLQERQYRTV
jgi:hypothetical protein